MGIDAWRKKMRLYRRWRDVHAEAYAGDEAHEALYREWLEFVSGPTDGILLDVGAGSGWVRKLLPEEQQYVGVDPLAEQISEEEVLPAMAEYLPFPDGLFDVVLMAEVLDHVVDPEPAICEAVRVLKRGGVLGVRSVPPPPASSPGLIQRIRSGLRRMIGGVSPVETKMRFIEQEDLESWLSPRGRWQYERRGKYHYARLVTPATPQTP